MAPRPFPGTLFDFNGVLIDDEHVHLDAFRDAVAPLGIEITEEAYWERYLGFDDAGGFDAILRDAGRVPAPGEVERLVEEKRPHYLRRAETALRGFERAAEVVRERAAAGPVAIVSGALRDEVELGLRFLGVRDLVGWIVAAEDAASKPDPEGYVKGRALLATQLGEEAAQRALVIEDSLAGIEAAKAIGLPCVAVAHSYSREELGQSAADAVYDKLGDITPEVVGALYEKLYG